MITSKLGKFISCHLVPAFIAICGVLSSGSASATNPDHVTFTLEGCRNTGNVPLTTTTGGVLVCPNGAYTTGNLGKGWNELDLVPMRITSQAGSSAPATQTFTIAAVVDYVDGSPPTFGYDFITPTFALNASKSSAGCNLPVISTGARGTEAVPGLGGISKSLYRTMTLTQTKGTTCVYDYDARLALGSHNFPGSSLHVNLALVDPTAPGSITTSGIGARDVSIPVKEILPQDISKTMMATQNTDSTWSVSKSASPANVNFGDVCAAAPTPQPVSITVTWTKTPAAAGAVNVVTTIKLTNPAARSVIAAVTDLIYNGSDQTSLLDTKVFNPTPVPANSSVTLTHTATLDSSVGPTLNDVATAVYTDATFPDVTIPGTTVAKASTTVAAGLAANTSAIISDTESITGTGLTFAVASPSISGFDNYTANAATTGPVSWTTVTPQVAGNSVVFSKTISLDTLRVTSGTLSDTAALVAFNSDGTPGTATGTASASVNVSSDATVKLNISKTIPAVTLGTGEKIVVTFTIGRNGSLSTQQRTITFINGDPLTKTLALADVISGPPDFYTVTEESARFFDASNVEGPSGLVPSGGSQKQVDLRLDATGAITSCVGTASFVNVVASTAYAHAQVKKSTDPVIGSGDADYYWEFKLYGPGSSTTPIGTLSSVPANAAVPEFSGFVDGFGQPLNLTAEGKYVVKETAKVGWDVTSVATRDGTSSDCTFSINYPNDTGALKSCAFTNTKRAKAKVVKTLSGAVPTGSVAFTFQLRSGATLLSSGSTLEALDANAANGGLINFTSPLVPGIYQVCELVMPGYKTSLGPSPFVPNSLLADGVTPNPGVDNSVMCANLVFAAGETKTITVDNTPPPTPGGQALTIGFWKNWASCKTSGGNQKPILDQTMAAAETKGIPLGTFALHGSISTPNVAPDCKKAVNLLSKSTMTQGKNMASDPIFNMTAQLVAAELNGAKFPPLCPAVAGTIANANALLITVQFNGDAYTSKLLTAALATTANNYAKKLDDFNNDRASACQ